ncbi:hypothetical protein INR49_029760 [Caranx melampygus]|nr:hypothetical protein INR49_029760 [Caranx melampygus]
MSSTEQLDALREQNTDLLNRLKRQREKLESVSSCSQGRKRERQDEAEERTQAEEIVRCTGGDRRSALSKLSVRFAGVLDSEDSLIERSDTFFDDLRMFRSLHKDECVHSSQAEFSEEHHSGLPLLTDKDEPETDTDTHQCTFSYRINSRLFPVPLHTEHCPVCKKHKSTHPHTSAEPALIRVSIARSTLLPPHKYKAHRRCSFDPSDSLGLPSHCLSGWSHTGQSTVPPPSTLDLQSSLNTKSSTESQNKELEDLAVPKVSCHHISNVSRLVRHNFQHFSTQKQTQKKHSKSSFK